jgi:hypothetical protein
MQDKEQGIQIEFRFLERGNYVKRGVYKVGRNVFK